jgi:hypothetical protein
MTESEPTPPPFQYSIWSLLVLATFVAVICSMVASAGWSVPILIAFGAGVCLIGFGPLSWLKHPKEGFIFILAGFVVRLIGLVIVAFGVALWVLGVGRGK